MSWHTGQLPGSLWQKWLLKARNLKHQAKKLWRHWCWISPGWYTKAILCSRAVKIILIAAWMLSSVVFAEKGKPQKADSGDSSLGVTVFFFFCTHSNVVNRHPHGPMVIDLLCGDRFGLVSQKYAQQQQQTLVSIHHTYRKQWDNAGSRLNECMCSLELNGFQKKAGML